MNGIDLAYTNMLLSHRQILDEMAAEYACKIAKKA